MLEDGKHCDPTGPYSIGVGRTPTSQRQSRQSANGPLVAMWPTCSLGPLSTRLRTFLSFPAAAASGQAA